MKDYKQLAKEARIAVLGMIHKAQTSHIASNFSCIDIATVLYENIKEEDKVVWSKGWAAAAIYYYNAKYDRGDKQAVEQFPNDPYFGLAETTVQGVEVNGGSVGHGLSVAVGMALGKKRAGEKGTVYCIMSDGELNEGSVWEAAMMAGHHELNNLVAIVDSNGWQAMGKTSEVLRLNPVESFLSFNWKAMDIDGHDFESIERIWTEDFPKGLSVFPGVVNTRDEFKPLFILANTVKGKGVSFMENHLLYHYKNITDEDYQKALTELQNA